MAKYDLSAFLEAQISAARYERAHPDLATYHSGRARVLRSAFGVEPTELPGHLDMIFEDAIRVIVRTRGAFDGMMECPRTLTPFVLRHDRSINAAVNAVREAHLALMRDLLESVHAVETRWSRPTISADSALTMRRRPTRWTISETGCDKKDT